MTNCTYNNISGTGVLVHFTLGTRAVHKGLGFLKFPILLEVLNGTARVDKRHCGPTLEKARRFYGFGSS